MMQNFWRHVNQKAKDFENTVKTGPSQIHDFISIQNMTQMFPQILFIYSFRQARQT